MAIYYEGGHRWRVRLNKFRVDEDMIFVSFKAIETQGLNTELPSELEVAARCDCLISSQAYLASRYSGCTKFTARNWGPVALELFAYLENQANQEYIKSIGLEI